MSVDPQITQTDHCPRDHHRRRNYGPEHRLPSRQARIFRLAPPGAQSVDQRHLMARCGDCRSTACQPQSHPAGDLCDGVVPSPQRESGQATGYRRTGGYWLAQSQHRLTELKRIAEMGIRTGLHVKVIAGSELPLRLPYLKTDDLAGALWVAEDGQTNPVDTCMAYASAAKRLGVRILERTAVSGIVDQRRKVRGVTIADEHSIRCGFVVNCAGAWARLVGAMAGVSVPLQPVEHMYVVTEPIEPANAISDIARPRQRYLPQGRRGQAGARRLRDRSHSMVIVGRRPCVSYFQENWQHF